MFDFIRNFFANAAFETAVYSAGLASVAGMHQPQEPKDLQKIALKAKK